MSNLLYTIILSYILYGIKKGTFMKKILILFALLIFLTPIAEASQPTPQDIAPMGFKILESNNIQKRMVFKYTTCIKNPRATLDYKPKNTSLDTTGRIIWIYGDALDLVADENELAAMLSYAIAIGESSYRGLFRGFFSQASYSCFPATSRKKENIADLKAIDYMVKAGYNPLALITFYNKTLAQTRYEWCHFSPLTTKRMINIYEYIYKNYPQYLKNNSYANNIYYQNFLHNTTKEMKKLEKKLIK